MFDFKLPSLGADMEEGKLLEWLVKPGDTVDKGQVVAVVDTSKAAVDVEIWHKGTVHALLVGPGEKIPVGTVLATVLEPGETAPAAAPPALRPAASGARKRISPAARRKAEQLGVDCALIAGTGADGAVTLADIERAVAGGTGTAAAEAAKAPHRPASPADRQAETRRAIAAAMSRSKREIPHYYLFETVALARAQQWLTVANEGRPIAARLLLAVLQMKAVARAVKRYPEMNGYFRDGGFEPAESAHVGVAISLRQGGLIAPALHDADRKPLEQLMRELTDLVKRTRAGSLRGSELTDATITVTNLGEQGVEGVVGVIHPPQVALVGFGRVALRPWVEDGKLCAMPTVMASLAADHRVSDGHRGALFMAELRELLQQPQDL